MYYLVKKTLGRSRCIHQNADDIYEDGQSYDCLAFSTFDPDDKIFLRTIRIRCINLQGRQTHADVYCDLTDTKSSGNDEQ
jgi:hypothetical protein